MSPRSEPQGRTKQLADSIRRERRDDVAVLWLDVPDHAVNVLHRELAADVDRALDALDDDVVAVVIASAKPSGFVAGADVDMLAEVEGAADGEALSREAQAVMNRIADFRLPVVAAIDGACLGGGLELALACRARVASDADDTRLGFPEVQLGLIPGAGGTQRLPRRVGLEDALTLILTGRRLTGRQALDMGLVDEVVYAPIVVDVAVEHARRLAGGEAPRRKKEPVGERLRELLTEGNPLGRWAMLRQSKAQTENATHGLVPAPQRAIEVIRVGLHDGFEAGLTAEAEAFGALLQTNEAQNLIGLFRAGEALKAERWVDAEPRPVTQVGVIGAGLMGGGIAYVSAVDADARVRLKDVERAPVREALRTVRGLVDAEVDKGLLDARRADRIMGRLTGTTRDDGFGGAQLVIEAVAEDLDVKRQVLAEVEAMTGEDTVFASNTSAIPIEAIAAEATRPQNVVGMHYFSPVPKVPLLEVVQAPASSPAAVATAVAFGKRQGRTVIVVNDGPGFYTSRVLGRYLAEAALMLSEGVAIDAVDEAMVEVGFPVGPFQLMDEVGLDVAAGVSKTLSDAFGARMTMPNALTAALEDRPGRKGGKGFYGYVDGERVGPDDELYALLGVEARKDKAPEAIAPRLLAAFAHEAARCHGDGVVRSARDADVGAVMGLGFPAQRGGPLRMIDDMGVDAFVAQLDELTRKHGARFAPAPVLREAVLRGVGFYGGLEPGWHRSHSSDAIDAIGDEEE